MNQTQNRPSRRTVRTLILAGLALTAAVAWAQPRTAPPATSGVSYEYVGVGISLVRVDRHSGRIEILEQRDAPGVALTIDHARPWTWREIKVDDRPRTPADRPARNRGGTAGQNDD